MGDLGDEWRATKAYRRQAERRIGRTECSCGAKTWNDRPLCHYCGQPNSGYVVPKTKKARVLDRRDNHAR
jgi:uncharacterized OB-fold protein